MNESKRWSFLFAAGALVFAGACGGSSNNGSNMSNNMSNNMTNNMTSGSNNMTSGSNNMTGGSNNMTSGSNNMTTGTNGMMTLSIDLTGAPNLGTDYMYEGWLIDADGPHSTGRFSVDDNGMATPSTFMVDSTMVDNATDFVLTIEPAQNDDPAPSMTHFMAGPITAGMAMISTSDAKALGTDFSSAAGSYILATPSTAMDTSDNNQGIWWLMPGMPKTASLTLPTLPAGWKYEGWVVGANGPVSTGKFTDPAAADDDGTGPTAGPDDGPPFPGQDFINPAMMLADGTYKAVITVEPDPDNSPMPFAIKPLVDMMIESVAAPMSQDMSAGPAAPTGMVMFQ